MLTQIPLTQHAGTQLASRHELFDGIGRNFRNNSTQYYEKCIIEHNIYLLFYFPESSFVINASPLEYSHSSHNHSFDHMTCFFWSY